MIKGNGILTTKRESVSSFLQLHLSINGLVELHQGIEEKIEVETDENLINYCVATNSGKTLFVSAEAGYRSLAFTSLKVKVYFRQITRLYVRSEKGDVICNNTISLVNPLDVKIQSFGNTSLSLDVPMMKVLIQSVGNVTLIGKCVEADIKTQAEGNLFAKELIAQDLKLKNMSQGNVEVSADKTISISHFGDGYVHYFGNAILKDVNQRGGGEIKHLNPVL